MNAVQLTLFEPPGMSMDDLEGCLVKTQDGIDSLRRGIFRRHGELTTQVAELRQEIAELRALLGSDECDHW